MSRSGTSVGTVVRWDEQSRDADVEVSGPGGDCWAGAAVVDDGDGDGTLRAGQVVAVEWLEEPAYGLPFHAVRVRRRGDLQSTPGA